MDSGEHQVQPQSLAARVASLEKEAAAINGRLLDVERLVAGTEKGRDGPFALLEKAVKANGEAINALKDDSASALDEVKTKQEALAASISEVQLILSVGKSASAPPVRTAWSLAGTLISYGLQAALLIVLLWLLITQ